MSHFKMAAKKRNFVLQKQSRNQNLKVLSQVNFPIKFSSNVGEHKYNVSQKELTPTFRGS